LAFQGERGTLWRVMWGAIVAGLQAAVAPSVFLGGDMATVGDGSQIVRRDANRWFGRIARAYRRYPWLGRMTQRGMRLIQPRFTVGAVGVLLDASGERVLLVEHVFHAVRPGAAGRVDQPA
jgi:hypothetical protein